MPKKRRPRYRPTTITTEQSKTLKAIAEAVGKKAEQAKAPWKKLAAEARWTALHWADRRPDLAAILLPHAARMAGRKG